MRRAVAPGGDAGRTATSSMAALLALVLALALALARWPTWTLADDYALACDAVAREGRGAAVARRAGTGAGLHPTLTTTLVARRGCRVALLESLPRGAFVDADQVRDLERRGFLGGARVRGLASVDVEAPAERVRNDSVPLRFVVDATRSRASRAACARADLLELTVGLPLHLRYHAPLPPNANSQHADVEVPPPVVCAAECAGEAVSAPSDACVQVLAMAVAEEEEEQAQAWSRALRAVAPARESSEDALARADLRVRFRVPVGSAAHEGVVTAVTVLSVAAGCVAVVASTVPRRARASRVRVARWRVPTTARAGTRSGRAS